MNTINSTMNFQKLLGIIIDSCKELLNCEAASLLILDKENEELIFDIVVSEKGEIIRGRRININEGVAGHVAQTSETMVVNDVSNCDNFCNNIDDISGYTTHNILATPVSIKGELFGVLEAINSKCDAGFTEEDHTVIKYVADAAAIAINNNELFLSLRNRVSELTCIYEISQSIFFTFDINDFLKKILTAVNEVIKAEKCSFVILKENSTSEVEYFVSTKDITYNINLENSLMSLVIKSGDPLLVYNADNDTNVLTISKSQKTYKSKSFICVPMKLRDKIIGVLNVTDKPHGDAFDSFDLRVLSTVANQVAETYENIKLEKDNTEKENLEKELAIASELQRHSQSIIPSNSKELSIDAFSISSESIGGDFFEITSYDESFLGGSVGDVSGKGIHAAIFMNNIRNALRFEAVKHKEPPVILKQLNRWAYKESFSGMFCTFAYCLVDKKHEMIKYSSAGHNEQIFFESKSNTFSTLKTKGKPLGVLEEFEFDVMVKKYEPGDMVILFSDGLIEEEHIGAITKNYLMDFISDNKEKDAKTMVSHIKKRIAEKASGKKLKDDSTLLIMKFH